MNSAYAAGLIDGEGTIALYTNPDYPHKADIAVGIEMMSEPVTRLFKDYAKCTRCQTNKGSYKLHVTGSSLIKLLHETLPFLIEKKSQALTVLKYKAFQKLMGPKPPKHLATALVKRLAARCKEHKTRYDK